MKTGEENEGWRRGWTQCDLCHTEQCIQMSCSQNHLHQSSLIVINIVINIVLSKLCSGHSIDQSGCPLPGNSSEHGGPSMEWPMQQPPWTEQSCSDETECTRPPAASRRISTRNARQCMHHYHWLTFINDKALLTFLYLFAILILYNNKKW